MLAALPAAAKKSQSTLDECLAALTVYLVGDTLEGAPFDEFYGVGELFAVTELGRQAMDTNLCGT